MTADTLHLAETGWEIHKVVVGPVDNNVFILRCTRTGDAVLLDAANEHDLLLDLCETLGVRTVLETHGHWDHIQAIPAVRDAGYRVGVTAEDAGMLESYDYLLEDESVIEVGDLRLHAIATPGHTPGSMSFRLEGAPVLFSGDTLFPGGPGNTSFEHSDFDTIIESIDRRMFTPISSPVARLHRALRPAWPDGQSWSRRSSFQDRNRSWSAPLGPVPAPPPSANSRNV
jgi:glyoxylase-like metal-dependent hydrolase (beta-lactamase superfamily II)